MSQLSIYSEEPIARLLDAVHTGEILNPFWHRTFVWSEKQVLELFDSLYLWRWIGGLTFWRPDEAKGETIGMGCKSAEAQLLTVDGHQRLAALYAVMRSVPVRGRGYNEVSLRVAFRPRDGHFRTASPRVCRDPEYLPDISTLWSGDLSLDEITGAFLDRLRDHRKVPSSQADAVAYALVELKSRSDRALPVWELGPSHSMHEIIDIYTRENTRYTREDTRHAFA